MKLSLESENKWKFLCNMAVSMGLISNPSRSIFIYKSKMSFVFTRKKHTPFS